ncbi:MAG: beta-propeller fold lactonase family protein [Verrucomicrobia bacterium]|nr:beta-propeller fold lactonase family protein [Verrucomicrobiota bacterium]
MKNRSFSRVVALQLTTAVLASYLMAANCSPATAQTTAQNNSISLKWFRGIVVGNTPYRLAITPNGREVYVSNFGSNTVSVIDASLYTVVATIPVPDEPSYVAITPDGSACLVVAAGRISVISTATKTVVKNISAGSNPNGFAITPDGKQLYVCNPGLGFNDGAVTIIDLSTDQIQKTIAIPGSPVNVMISPDGKSVYVIANYNERGYLDRKGFVVKIDVASQTVLALLGGGRVKTISGALAISPNSETLYVGEGSSDVLALNPDTGETKRTLVIFSPYARKRAFRLDGIQLSSNGRYLFVAESGQHAITAVNAWKGEQVASVMVGREPIDIAVSPDGKYLYVANSERGTVSIVKIERP